MIGLCVSLVLLFVGVVRALMKRQVELLCGIAILIGLVVIFLRVGTHVLDFMPVLPWFALVEAFIVVFVFVRRLYLKNTGYKYN